MKKISFSGPEDYLALLRRRKWWIVISFIVLASVATLIALLLPNIYQSETLILTQPRDIPDDVVKDFVTVDTQQRLTAIQETVLSRTNLLRVINEFSGEFGRAMTELNDEEQVERLRSRILIEITTERNRREEVVPYFKISYQDRDPELAQKVTDRLASLFIEQDARTRENQVFGTVEFLNNEVAKVSSQLDEAEENLAQLKKSYRYELPEQLETNLRTLDRLHEQLKSNLEAHDRYMSMKLDLERQLSETPQVITKDVATTRVNARQDSDSLLVEEYREKDRRLKELRSRYTEKYPEVTRLKAELNALRAVIPPEDLIDIESSASLDSDQVDQVNPLYSQLSSQLRQVNTELNILKESRDWLEQEVSNYAVRVQNTPLREQQIAGQERRYDDLRAQYDDLKNKLTQARLAESLESRQKGEQFQIVDPASYPVRPAKPNRLMVVLFGLFGSLGFGLVLAFAADVLDQRVWTQREIERRFGLPVVAEVPEILEEEEASWRKRKGWLALGLVVLLSLLSAATIYLIYQSNRLHSLGSEALAGLLQW